MFELFIPTPEKQAESFTIVYRKSLFCDQFLITFTSWILPNIMKLDVWIVLPKRSMLKKVEDGWVFESVLYLGPEIQRLRVLESLINLVTMFSICEKYVEVNVYI